MKIFGMKRNKVSDLVRNGQITIDVVGIGKMGLPLAVLLAKSGANVVGVRKNQHAVDMINRGECPIMEEPNIPKLLKEVVDAGRFRATTDGTKAAQSADVVIFLVPLLVDKDKDPDYSIIRSAVNEASSGIEKGDLVITETTMPPGATESVIKPILEKNGLVAGVDFGLAHSPERLMTGRVIRNLKRYPKIVGGIDNASTEATAGLYQVISDVITVSNIKTAELVKVAEGVYRDLNIAYANLLARYSSKANVNVWEVIDAATTNTTDYCHIHNPGAGVGGHCIPVYPWFLIKDGVNNKLDMTLIETARSINDNMPLHVTTIIEDCLASQKTLDEKPTVGVLGITFRPNVKETRFSPSLTIINKLHDKYEVWVNDPFYTKEEIQKMGFKYATFEEILKTNCIVLIVPHTSYEKDLSKLDKYLFKLVDATTGPGIFHTKWKIGKPAS